MAHITDLGFTMDELEQAIVGGNVRRQTHPEFPELAIHNYCEEVQFKNNWDKITLACRGLIINLNTEEIVARPWEKFFNLGQMDNRIDSNAPVGKYRLELLQQPRTNYNTTKDLKKASEIK